MRSETKIKVWTEWVPAPGEDLVPRTHWEVEGDKRLISVLGDGWITPFPDISPFSPGEGRIRWTVLAVPSAEDYIRFKRRIFEAETEIRKIASIVRAIHLQHQEE